MSVIACLVAANLAASPPALILVKLRPVDDPRGYDLIDEVNGDRGVPKACSLAGDTIVKLLSAKDATLEVERAGSMKRIVVKDVQALARATLSCGQTDTFYYANPRLGDVYAYSADRLFRGDDPVVWTRRVQPFTNIDDAHGVVSDASVATVVLARQKQVLVEWFFRKEGITGFWHEVLDADTGEPVGKLGPSDLLVKTNEHDPWWIVFQGGGNETVNYVPQNLYRLKVGPLVHGARAAKQVLADLRTRLPARRLKAVTKLSPNPVINHIVALLTPTRTAVDARIGFCPQVPAQRAKYWLGDEYDPELAALATDILLAFWAERADPNRDGNPIDAWFQSEIAPHEPMKALIATFGPHDDQWIGHYQQALLALGRPTFERLFVQYGTASRGSVP